MSKYILPDFPNGGSIPVGVQPDDVSPRGVRDMAGNVSEWTASQFEEYTDSDYTVRGPERRFYVFKGGSWGSDDAKEPRIAYRGRGPRTMSDIYIGFRCARDAK